MEQTKQGSMTIDQILAQLAAQHAAEAPINEGLDAWHKDRAWIVAAHNYYPRIAAHIRELADENTRLREQLRRTSADAGDALHAMQAQIETAERRGAVEELRRLADEWERLYAPGLADALRDHAAKLEGK